MILLFSDYVIPLLHESGSESGSKYKTRPTPPFLTGFAQFPRVRSRSPAVMYRREACVCTSLLFMLAVE